MPPKLGKNDINKKTPNKKGQSGQCTKSAKKKCTKSAKKKKTFGGEVGQPAGRFYCQKIGSKMCQPKAGRPRSSMVEHQRAPEVRPHSIRSVLQILLVVKKC